MTAQMGDTYIFDDKNYDIVAISEKINFDPTYYGITPVSCCTACWNGYWCKYNITENGIVLEDLFINSKDNFYPVINGVSALAEEDKKFTYMGHHLYKDLNLLIDYTGRIVAGRDFIQDFYIHMGYQDAWGYKTLVEFVFEQGKLIDTIDHSKITAQLRKKIRMGDIEILNKIKKDISQFVTDSFSLDFMKKCWWLD